jgi:hypothetical protein
MIHHEGTKDYEEKFLTLRPQEGQVLRTPYGGTQGGMIIDYCLMNNLS